jgi:DNA-binding transcriptional ArsR family regulator
LTASRGPPYSRAMSARALSRSRSRRTADDIFDLIGKGDNIRQASSAMQAMAHPLRLKILCLVGNQELAVSEIVEAVGTSQSNISQHLSVLRDNGLLEARKDATKVLYRITDARIVKMIALTREIFCA